MKKSTRRMLAGAMAALMVVQSPNVALADSEKVVTLGADLTQAERTAMLEYFGVTEDEVTIIEVNNQEERSYLEGIATEAEIGTHTYSCAYIMPTSDGEIDVATAHLTWVSTSMIANTLVTAGIDSCDVIAAAPRDVSGTGALTGIIKAYEKVTDEELDEEKTDLAMQELYNTAEMGSEIGQDEASAVMNEVKAQVIKDGLTDEEEIADVVDEVADYYNVNLSDERVAQVSKLMASIGAQDYDYDKLQGTMEDLQNKLVDNLGEVSESFMEKTDGGGILAAIGGFFAGIFEAIGNFFSGLFGGGSDEKESILDNIDNSAIGVEETDDAGTDNTNTSQDTTGTDTDANANTDAGITTDTEASSPDSESTDTTTQSDSFTVDENKNVIQQEESTDSTNMDEAVEGANTGSDLTVE